jgi:hypothetical protein
MVVDMRASESKRGMCRPGDRLVDPADLVVDRAFDIPAPPEILWPFVVQSGTRRSGGYVPAESASAAARRRSTAASTGEA